LKFNQNKNFHPWRALSIILSYYVSCIVVRVFCKRVGVSLGLSFNIFLLLIKKIIMTIFVISMKFFLWLTFHIFNKTYSQQFIYVAIVRHLNYPTLMFDEVMMKTCCLMCLDSLVFSLYVLIYLLPLGTMMNPRTNCFPTG